MFSRRWFYWFGKSFFHVHSLIVLYMIRRRKKIGISWRCEDLQAQGASTTKFMAWFEDLQFESFKKIFLKVCSLESFTKVFFCQDSKISENLQFAKKSLLIWSLPQELHLAKSFSIQSLTTLFRICFKNVILWQFEDSQASGFSEKYFVV